MQCFKAYLELASKLIHLASVLVEVSRVAPDKAHLIFEGIPGLEVSNTSRRCTAMNAFDALLYAFQRYWMSDGLVVLFELPCRQIDERCIDL